MKKILAIFLSLFVFSYSYSQDLNQQATELFNQAKTYLNNKQYNQAIDTYDQSATLFLKAGNIESYKIAGINELDLMIKTGQINNAIPLSESLYNYISKLLSSIQSP